MKTTQGAEMAPPMGLGQDWSEFDIGKRVHVKLASGETYFGVIDDANQERTFIWIAADGLRGRTLLHCEGPEAIQAVY